MSLKAMKQALDLLETSWGCGDEDTLKRWNETAQLLRLAIERVECVYVDFSDISQESVDETAKDKHEPWVKTYCGGKPNYTTPPDVDIYDVWVEHKNT